MNSKNYFVNVPYLVGVKKLCNQNNKKTLITSKFHLLSFKVNDQTADYNYNSNIDLNLKYWIKSSTKCFHNCIKNFT